VNAIIYDGIAKGKNSTKSKKFFPLKFVVDTNQAGIIPSINEKKTVSDKR
tara:strand:+ start:1824 stop:1973 length:150 start_codon:yes stop_codon:yes gene_type:complete